MNAGEGGARGTIACHKVGEDEMVCVLSKRNENKMEFENYKQMCAKLPPTWEKGRS
jgi:hypothetical protein